MIWNTKCKLVVFSSPPIFPAHPLGFRSFLPNLPTQGCRSLLTEERNCSFLSSPMQLLLKGALSHAPLSSFAEPGSELSRRTLFLLRASMHSEPRILAKSEACTHLLGRTTLARPSQHLQSQAPEVTRVPVYPVSKFFLWWLTTSRNFPFFPGIFHRILYPKGEIFFCGNINMPLTNLKKCCECHFQKEKFSEQKSQFLNI